MDAISTTVPSINLRKLHPKPHHLKPPSFYNLHHISTGKPPSSSLLSKPTTHSHHHHHQPTPQPPPSSHTHRNAATGYAAALVDAALKSNLLDVIHNDVKRLLKWLKYNEMLKDVMGDPLVDEGVKGKVIKEVAEKGGLGRQVVVMVKMLVAKKKAEMVVKVMEEFEGIYWELNRGLRVVS